MSWWSTTAAQYGPTGAGLAIGTAAKYGLTLTEGQPVTWRGLVADLLLLGILGLVAIQIADWWALTGNMRVLVGALAAVSSDRLVRLIREYLLKRAESELATAARLSPGASVIPAGVGPPPQITVAPGIPDTPLARTGAALRVGLGTVRQRPPADQIELLRQLPD